MPRRKVAFFVDSQYPAGVNLTKPAANPNVSYNHRTEKRNHRKLLNCGAVAMYPLTDGFAGWFLVAGTTIGTLDSEKYLSNDTGHNFCWNWHRFECNGKCAVLIKCCINHGEAVAVSVYDNQFGVNCSRMVNLVWVGSGLVSESWGRNPHRCLVWRLTMAFSATRPSFIICL